MAVGISNSAETSGGEGIQAFCSKEADFLGI